MARPKAFDRDAALEKAMHMFWTKGYEATSLDDLLRAMQIGRQSLYDTFGDKRALFLTALERYQELLDEFLSECLEGSPTVKEAMQRLFLQVANEPDEHKRRGCLMVNSAMELSPHDPATAQLVSASQKTSERLFQRALELARARGELKKDREIRPLARFLVSALQGLRVAAKADPDKARLRDIAEVALSVLD